MELIAFTLFVIKHTIADYLTQYNWMIRDKATYGAFGGLAHSGWHGILTSLVVWHITALSFYAVILIGLVDSLIHYHVDYVKSNVWKNKRYTPADQMYWVTHGIDQMCHLFTYIFIIWFLISINSI